MRTLLSTLPVESRDPPTRPQTQQSQLTCTRIVPKARLPEVRGCRLARAPGHSWRRRWAPAPGAQRGWRCAAGLRGGGHAPAQGRFDWRCAAGPRGLQGEGRTRGGVEQVLGVVETHPAAGGTKSSACMSEPWGGVQQCRLAWYLNPTSVVQQASRLGLPHVWVCHSHVRVERLIACVPVSLPACLPAPAAAAPADLHRLPAYLLACQPACQLLLLLHLPNCIAYLPARLPACEPDCLPSPALLPHLPNCIACWLPASGVPAPEVVAAKPMPCAPLSTTCRVQGGGWQAQAQAQKAPTGPRGASGRGRAEGLPGWLRVVLHRVKMALRTQRPAHVRLAGRQ